MDDVILIREQFGENMKEHFPNLKELKLNTPLFVMAFFNNNNVLTLGVEYCNRLSNRGNYLLIPPTWVGLTEEEIMRRLKIARIDYTGNRRGVIYVV
jgi:hypothetical protein